MPTSQLPSGSSRTENASSISVVVASSIENARTSCSGSSGGGGGAAHAGNAVPRGNACVRNASKWYSCVDGMAPQAASSATGFVCCASQAAASAFHSSDVLVRPVAAASAASPAARRAAGPARARRPTRRSAPPRAACARPRRAPPSARPAAPCGTGPCRACRSTSAPRRSACATAAASTGRRRVAVVLARELVEAELVVAGDLPQEVRVEPAPRAAAPRRASADGDGAAKRSSTAAALIFRRLPDAASTCSEVSLSARTVPALSWPSSSKKTCMGGNRGGRGCLHAAWARIIAGGRRARPADGTAPALLARARQRRPRRRRRSRRAEVPRRVSARRACGR